MQKILYHGCLEGEVESILVEGLLLSKSLYGTTARQYRDKPATYLARSPEYAGTYGDTVLVVKLPEDVIVTKSMGKDVIVASDIPPEYISVFGESMSRKSQGYKLKRGCK